MERIDLQIKAMSKPAKHLTCDSMTKAELKIKTEQKLKTEKN